METTRVPLNLQTTVSTSSRGSLASRRRSRLRRPASLVCCQAPTDGRDCLSVWRAEGAEPQQKQKHVLPCPPPAPGTARPGRRPCSPVEIIGQSHGQQGGADPPEQAGRVAGQHLRILLKVGERRLAAGAGQPPAEDEKWDYGQAHTAWASATQTICPARRGHHFWMPPSQQRPAGLAASADAHGTLEPHRRCGPLLGPGGGSAGAH